MTAAYQLVLAAAALAWGVVGVAGQGAPLVPPATGAANALEGKAAERSISDWLMRMHEGSRNRAYAGTFVVSSANTMSSARIWHICDGEQQIERVESLTGAPRSTFRRNDEVITFNIENKTALAEKREALGMFPNMLKATDSAIAQFYAAKHVGVERVAGYDADVVQLLAKDSLRFGYRIWSERKTGLVVKLQTLDTDGRVLEQAAYSELQLDAPVSMGKLSQMMANVDGYRVSKPELAKTTALAEGWILKAPVAGFKPMSCFKRVVNRGEGVPQENAMQWIFSDGLASVSLFVEAFDRLRHTQEGLLSMGATKSLTRKLSERSGEKPSEWWLTVVGEVPTVTLSNFSQGLDRKK